MSEDKSILKDAVIMAMEAEKEAAEFYEQAAGRTNDSTGREMFNQLVSFEKSHYAALKNFFESIDSESFEGYMGTEFSPVASQKQQSPLSDEYLKTDIDAISIAIEAEKKAKEAYVNIAESVKGTKVADFFSRLAKEEELHKKVLEDQFLVLSNKGYWTWGE